MTAVQPTGLSDIFMQTLQASLRNLVHTDGLVVWERGQHAGKKPHPLVAISTGKTKDLKHFIGALYRGENQVSTLIKRKQYKY